MLHLRSIILYIVYRLYTQYIGISIDTYIVIAAYQVTIYKLPPSTYCTMCTPEDWPLQSVSCACMHAHTPHKSWSL